MNVNKRVALLIGNSHYGDNNDVSGVRDAEELKKCLEPLGFEVLPVVLDADVDAANEALKDFGKKIKDAGVALLFYSGHGFQSEGKNYLLPPRSPLSTEGALLLDNVLQMLAFAPHEAFKFAFLDACRDYHQLPDGLHQGFIDPAAVPFNVLQCFAASPGQVAASGSPDGLSPYTMSLLEYLPEPGLDLPNLFAKIHAYVPRPQLPMEAGPVSLSFFFKAPVFAHAKVPSSPNDSLLVLLNGEIVLNTREPIEKDLRLKAGSNELILLVSHGKTHRNGHDWDRTEGWHYEFDLALPDSRTEHFGDGEPIPFKGGPHHGQAFIVAKAHIEVDRKTAAVTLAAEKDLWDKAPQTEAWAQNQGLLFSKSITDLNITPEDVLGDGIQLGKLAPIVRPFLAEFLKTGKLLGKMLADPNKTFGTVRGNKLLQPVVEFCMTEKRADRIRDLQSSIAAAINRAARPFDLFDHSLIAAIQEFGPSMGIPLNREDMRVWTALEDMSQEELAGQQPAVASQAADAPSAQELMAAAQDEILQPRPEEFLIGPMPSDQTVQGVPVSVQIYPFVSFTPTDDRLKIHARVVADLSDFQNKIGALVDTIPLPTDNCSHFGVDNIVARIWGKQITIDGNTATLRLNGDVDIWTCLKNPVLCSRIVFDEVHVLGATIRVPRPEFFDCNPPVKNRNLNQPFEATLPFSVSVVDDRTFALRLGDPSVTLGGFLGGVTSGILKIAGVDINAKVKEALDQVINPNTLRQALPDFLLAIDPVLSGAELLSNSGALALSLEMDGAIAYEDLGSLFQSSATAH